MSTRIPTFSPTAPISAPRPAPVPLCGVPWRPTRPPVDLDLWPMARRQTSPACFTTIATWENKGKNIEFDGTDYVWSKHVNFLRFLDLPRQRPQTCFEMAMLPPDEGVRRHVEGAGWRLADPRPVSADMGNYRDFIAGPSARRVHRRQGHLCPAEQRLVQRPRGLLFGERPSGRDDAHRLFDLLHGRRRPVRLRDP